MQTLSQDIEHEAHAAWENGQVAVAFELFKKGAEAGLIVCLLDLGYFYDVGLGTDVDKRMAMKWYRRAFRAGHPAAAANIAILYREVGRNRLMFQWFQRGARLGDGDDEVELAKLYISGVGVRRSLPLARECLKRAILSDSITEAGCEEAEALLRNL